MATPGVLRAIKENLMLYLWALNLKQKNGMSVTGHAVPLKHKFKKMLGWIAQWKSMLTYLLCARLKNCFKVYDSIILAIDINVFENEKKMLSNNLCQGIFHIPAL